jgi:hypothetical protein
MVINLISITISHHIGKPVYQSNEISNLAGSIIQSKRVP